MRHEDTGLKAKEAGYRFLASEPYPHFQVICVLSGRLLLALDGRESAVMPGEAVVLGTGSRFALACRGRGYRGAFFISCDPFPDDPGLAIHVAGCPALASIAALLAAEAEAPGASSGEEQLGDLGRVMARIAIRHAADREPAEPQAQARWWAERARLTIEANLRTGEHPRTVLAPLGLSYRQVARHLASVYGTSPKRLQARLRLEAAARLLVATRQQVTDIAFEFGFPSSQHFATRFRAAFGASPLAWRQSHRPT